MAICKICGQSVTTGVVVHPECLPHWIRLKDELPEDGKKVLVYGEGHTYFASRNLMYKDSTGEIRIPANYGSGATITHWMPLPEPPEVE